MTESQIVDADIETFNELVATYRFSQEVVEKLKEARYGFVCVLNHKVWQCFFLELQTQGQEPQGRPEVPPEEDGQPQGPRGSNGGPQDTFGRKEPG